MSVPPVSASKAIRLHALGLGRPWRAEEMALLLEASGYREPTAGLVRTVVWQHRDEYRTVLPGVYEAVME